MSDNDDSSTVENEENVASPTTEEASSSPSAHSSQEQEAVMDNVRDILSLSDVPSDERQFLRGEENAEAPSETATPPVSADAEVEPEQPPATSSDSATASEVPPPTPPPKQPANDEAKSGSFHREETSDSSIFDRYAALAAEDQYSILEEQATVETHPSFDREDSSLQGGRLWKMAGEEVNVSSAEGAQAPARTARLGPGARLAETIMERTRSRADPNALVAQISANKKYERTYIHHFFGMVLSGELV